MMRFCSLAIVFVLAACTSYQQGNNGSNSVSVIGGSFPDTEAPDPAPLIATNIPRGRCGTLLWTRSGGQITPVFRGLDTTQATMRIEGEEVPLVLQASLGDLRLGVRNRQLFIPVDQSVDVRSVETSFTWGQDFPNGSYISSGTITLNGPDGWSRILPVAGIAGCKA